MPQVVDRMGENDTQFVVMAGEGDDLVGYDRHAARQGNSIAPTFASSCGGTGDSGGSRSVTQARQ